MTSERNYRIFNHKDKDMALDQILDSMEVQVWW